MRTLVVVVATAVVSLTGGCTSPSPPADAPSSTPKPDDVPVVDSPACDEVRAGIDAFNVGDFDSTVEHFEAAIPLAEAQDDGSEAAGDLVDAVRYYAELAADDYPEASRSSRRFATYKAITLGQCSVVDGGTDDPGTNV